MTYKIVFVDEEQTQIDKFCRMISTELNGTDVELIPLFPEPNKIDMIEKIMQLSPHAVISDYLLNEKKIDIKFNVNYTGTQLIEEIESLKRGFPCFVISSHDSEASNNADDVNKVYPKDVYFKIGAANASTNGNVLSFGRRILIKIESYNKKINDAQKKVCLLRAKSIDNRLSYDEENELIELDSFLENAIDATSALPGFLKRDSNAEQLATILESINGLLDELKDAKKE